ncbi:MAG: hypothetical protein RKU31_01745 [Deltaproteobacteria bacterium]|jgi:hypothetical protein
MTINIHRAGRRPLATHRCATRAPFFRPQRRGAPARAMATARLLAELRSGRFHRIAAALLGERHEEHLVDDEVQAFLVWALSQADRGPLGDLAPHLQIFVAARGQHRARERDAEYVFAHSRGAVQEDY